MEYIEQNPKKLCGLCPTPYLELWVDSILQGGFDASTKKVQHR